MTSLADKIGPFPASEFHLTGETTNHIAHKLGKKLAQNFWELAQKK